MTSRQLIGMLLAMGTLLVAGPAAQAAPLTATGWWTQTPVAVAPDAPADGLVVEGAPDAVNPFAFGAMTYELESGETPQSLTLTVAPNTATTPNASLMLCPITTGFTPAQGGPIANAPSYDCTTKSTAAPSADGSYQFAVDNLASYGILAVAVLPTAATDRVVLVRPLSDSLKTVIQPTATSTDETSTVADSVSSTPALDATPIVAGATVTVPSLPTQDIAVVTQPRQQVSATATGPTLTRASLIKSHAHSRAPAFFFALLLVVAATLWLNAGAHGEQETVAP